MQADERIVLGNHGITDRAAPSECEPGRPPWPHGRGSRCRAVDQVSNETGSGGGCDWHTVNPSGHRYGLALIDDPERIGPLTTLRWTRPRSSVSAA